MTRDPRTNHQYTPKEIEKYFDPRAKRFGESKRRVEDIAWEMSALLDVQYHLRGFGPYSLWRIIWGERLFTPEQLNVFCEVLALSDEERWELKSAVAKDLCARQRIAIDLGELDYGHHVQLSRSVLNNVKQVQKIADESGEFPYYEPLRQYASYAEIDASWSRMQRVMLWLLDPEEDGVKAYLLSELGGAVVHYLDRRGQHRYYFALATAAADAAQRLGRRSIEGWLRIDAIPYVCLEHLNDSLGARRNLERGLKIAGDNIDLLAQGNAFMAWAYLVEPRTAQSAASTHNYLERALALASTPRCSPAVQSRVYWIAGEVAFDAKDYKKALSCYLRADRARNKFGPGDWTIPLKVVQVYLALEDSSRARELANEIQATYRETGLPPYETAILEFELAQAARLDGRQRLEAQHWQKFNELTRQLRLQQVSISPSLLRLIREFEAKAA